MYCLVESIGKVLRFCTNIILRLLVSSNLRYKYVYMAKAVMTRGTIYTTPFGLIKSSQQQRIETS